MIKSLCIAVAITLALSSMSVIIPMSDITVSATDPLPPRTHDGVYTVAAFPKEDDCPLVVQNARIIFDIEETPLTYDLSQDFSTYAGKVVTEYTLFNPTFETLKATLLLPFGMLPSYGWVYDENVQIAIDSGLPVFVSEFGICDASGNGCRYDEELEMLRQRMDVIM